MKQAAQKGVIEKQLIRVVTPEWARMRFHIKKDLSLKYGANPSSFNPPHPQTLPSQNSFLQRDNKKNYKP